VLVEDIGRVHANSRRRYGSPRGQASLRAEGKRVGRNRVARLMRKHGIQAHRRRPFRKTTPTAIMLSRLPRTCWSGVRRCGRAEPGLAG